VKKIKVDETRKTYMTHGELRYAYGTLIEESEKKRSVLKHAWKKKN